MSYIDMDHARWVASNIAASKSRAPTAREKRYAAGHKGWFAAPDELNSFQRRALDILGIVGNGIYNAPISWETAYWHPRMIAVSWRNPLATFDFTALTRFVFLCHEARIRGEISSKGFRYLEIHLSQCVDVGSIGRRHPNLDEEVAAFRQEFPADHSINYRKAPAVASLEAVA